jgi:MSHA biogenesis protein MshK
MLLCVASFAVSAQETLPDPTRQPAELSVLPVSAVSATAPLNTSLQSIMISHDRRAAIINGQLVKEGDLVGDATLVEVNEGSVVLQGAKGKQVLTLFPGVDIKKKEKASPNSQEFAPMVKKRPAGKKKKVAGKSVDYSAQTKKNEGEGK